MGGNCTETPAERLILPSRLSELARIPAWIELLGSRYAIPPSTQFAMELCLEEVLSNTIRYGYSAEPKHSMTVEFATQNGYFTLTVEDDARPFNPLDGPELPRLSTFAEFRIGGQGIRLLRRFADMLEYQPTSAGNRLVMGFSTISTAIKGT